MRTLSVLVISFLLTSAGSAGESGKERAADEAAIRRNLGSYIAAYRAKNASALASMWSETGRFLDPQTGNAISGRKGIEEAFRKLFENAGEVELDARVDSLRFLTDDVAVEEGKARVVIDEEETAVGNYQVLHVKEDGRWLIDSVRETAAGEVVVDEAASDDPDVPELGKLAWMIGEWTDAGDGASVEHSCRWGMRKSFLRRDFAVVIKDRVEIEGIEVIGWDPREKCFRSWVFDSGGGFGSAAWEKSGDEWLKKLRGTTRDGQKVYAVHAMKRIDDDSYEFRVHGRERDGVLQPNIDAVKVVRVVESE